MTTNTKQLVINKRTALHTAWIASVLLLVFLFASRSCVRAAQAPAAPPIDDAKVAPLLDLDRAVENVVDRVNPAVVNVAVTSRVDPRDAQNTGGDEGGDGDGSPFFRFFGMRPPQNQGPQLEHGIGSGAIISPDGYIVTNDHVVDGAVEVRVTLHDRRVLTAKVIGKDKLTDLAVIKVDAQNLPSIPWGDSTKLHPGQTVFAFGSPFGYFQFSVTRGIVSGLNRPNPFAQDRRKPGGFIQTDAAINPGNSGGPLVDARGEVVGINTFLISNSGSFAGAGFAIPSQLAHATVDALIKNGVVHHGYLGISISDVTPENAKFFGLKDIAGALVSQVTPDGPGAKGGLHSGDVVQAVNQTPVQGASDLQLAVSEIAPGTSITLHIIRDAKPMEIKVTVGEFKQPGKTEEAADSSRDTGGVLGVSVTDLTPDIRDQISAPRQLKGAVVQDVRPGSPAEDAGLGKGDVITEINRHPVSSASELSHQVHSLPKGDDVLLLVWSQGNSTYRVLHAVPGGQDK
jgi:serine protease Do